MRGLPGAEEWRSTNHLEKTPVRVEEKQSYTLCVCLTVVYVVYENVGMPTVFSTEYCLQIIDRAYRSAIVVPHFIMSTKGYSQSITEGQANSGTGILQTRSTAAFYLDSITEALRRFEMDKLEGFYF